VCYDENIMRKNILVVEDELDMQEALAGALIARDYTVQTADNGEEGLKLAIETEPDLIILDLLLPKMGGQEMLQKLRLHPKGKDVKVLMLTAMDDVENIGRGYEKGIADYIMKSNASLSDIVAKVSIELNV
tara:strand:- start:592 stop:984 length:393 start_codon:yes stop_codon:yes gene_type:complete